METKPKSGNGAEQGGMEMAAQRAAYESDKERIMADVKGVVSDAQELAKAVAASSAETLAAGRATLQSKASQMRMKMEDAQIAAAEKARKAADATQTYVVENPWKSLTVAALTGIVLGFLLSRRS